MLGLKELVKDPDPALRAIAKYKAEQSLIDFIRLMWPIIEPDTEFTDGWVIRAICEHLEAVTNGEINRLLINVPPGPGWVENLVATKRGPIRLGDIEVGDEVLTHRGRYRRVTNIFEQGRRPLLQIKTWSGRLTWATADHPYLTPHGWRRADELKVGDVLAVPVPREDALAMLVTPEEARFLGYIVGDGGVSHSPMFHNTEEEILSDFETCARSLGIKTRRGSKLPPSLEARGARFTHVGLRGALPILRKHGLCGCNSYTKRIPPLVMASGDEAIRHFVGAYWSCDGMIEVRKTMKRGSSFRSKCATVSEGLAKDLLYALARLGIDARIRRRARSNPTKTKQKGEDYVHYSVEIAREADTAILADMPIVSRKRDQAAICRRSFLPTIIEDEIISIENWRHGECRCVEVEEDHTMTWDGVVVSNSTKTLTTCCFWPAWEWGPRNKAGMRYLTAAYAAKLTNDANIKFRRLIMSDLYQEFWGENVKPAMEQFNVTTVANNRTGWKMASSVGGTATGLRGDRVILDDPNNPAEVESKLVLESTERWFLEVIPDRLSDLKRSVIIVIQQRTSEGDVSGIILSKRLPYVHVMIPLEYDPTRHCITPIGWEDPRGLDENGEPLSEFEREEKRGEHCWPERFDPRSVEDLKRTKGEFAWSGQYQQAPTPRGGGIFKREWLQAWPPPDLYDQPGMIVGTQIRYPALEYVCAWVDTAFGQKQESDFSAMAVLGLFRAEGRGRIDRRPDGTWERIADDYGYSKVILLYGWMKRLPLHGPPEDIPDGVSAKEWNSPLWLPERQKSWGLVEWVTWTCKKWKVDHLGIETQTGGIWLEQEIRRLQSNEKWGMELVQARGDKWARAHAVVPIISSGQFYVPMFEDGTYPSWCEPLVDQWCVFPKGQHDDFVDSLSGALKHLRDGGFFERRGEWQEAEVEAMTYPANKRVPLPYELG